MDSNVTTSMGKSLTTVAFERLRGDILSGEWQPAERLRIQVLCERYRVGGSAVREALSRLITEGLVEVEDQRGFNVAPVSRAELMDLTQTRVRVEQMALRLALERGDIEWEARLLGGLHRLARRAPPTDRDGEVQRAEAQPL